MVLNDALVLPASQSEVPETQDVRTAGETLRCGAVPWMEQCDFRCYLDSVQALFAVKLIQ